MPGGVPGRHSLALLLVEDDANCAHVGSILVHLFHQVTVTGKEEQPILQRLFVEEGLPFGMKRLIRLRVRIRFREDQRDLLLSQTHLVDRRQHVELLVEVAHLRLEELFEVPSKLLRPILAGGVSDHAEEACGEILHILEVEPPVRRQVEVPRAVGKHLEHVGNEPFESPPRCTEPGDHLHVP